MSDTRHQDKGPQQEARRPNLRGSRFRAWRNALASMLLVLAGLGTAIVALVARRTEDAQLAAVASIASLVIVLLIIIFVLPPLVRSARAEVSRLGLPLEVTMGGAIFLGILSIVAFAAWNTGNNLLFLILSVLGSTLFVSWAAARASLRDLVVSARYPDHIFAGEPAPVIVTLRNTKRLLPSFSIMVESRSQATQNRPAKKRRQSKRARIGKATLAYFMYVPHRAAAEQRVEQLFARRGHVMIVGFELSTRFPFGFFRRRRRLRARNVDIIVYPKPEPIGDELHLLPMNAGRRASVRRGAGHDLLSLRDYQPQDDLRHIDWKATARSRRLTVREFTAEDERRVTIALDIVGAGDAAPQEKDYSARFERGVTLAASLLAHFIDERAEVRLVLGQEAGRYGVGHEHLYACLRRLALVTPAPASDETARHAGAWESSPSSPVADSNYVILLTTASPGTIPSNVWRTSHVIYL